MVDVIGEPEGPDHAKTVLQVQQAAEKKETGDPNLETRLGEQQQRRIATRAAPDSLSTDGFTRWDNT